MSLPENKGYYRKLKNTEMTYPNPSFNQIELDLRRTFTESKGKSERLINKLRNVLYTFLKRNPTIGYCQGMNFIVGRLLRVMQDYSEKVTPDYSTASTLRKESLAKSERPVTVKKSGASLLAFRDDEKDEEEAFWILVMMMESMLPIDYYSSMVGVLIDQAIFYDLFKVAIPDLCKHFEDIGFDPSLLAF